MPCRDGSDRAGCLLVVSVVLLTLHLADLENVMALAC